MTDFPRISPGSTHWPQMLFAAAILMMPALAQAAPPAKSSTAFQLDPTGATSAKLGYYPVAIKLSAVKPKGITKEPHYNAAPQYGELKLGNGPRSRYMVALDEPKEGAAKIYLDVNQNGDLTDDGDGAWAKKTDRDGRIMYGLNHYLLRASYGTKSKETSFSKYGLAFYRFAGADVLLYCREAARVGKITVDKKVHKALLVENDGDGIFTVANTPQGSAQKPRPIWLLVDLKDDGKYDSGPVDVRKPFKLGGKNYEATINTDGSKLRLTPTTKAVVDLTPKQPVLLKAGTTAPDFTAEKWGGGELKLSDYRGKVVVLDFWATWCGPCQMSMPHIEKVHQAVAGKDVAVIGLCVWDEKATYEAWVPKNLTKYTFQFAYDPAGSAENNIALKSYQVSGIPTTYIIDKDGKVADTIVGYYDNDKRIEEALKNLGIELSASK